MYRANHALNCLCCRVGCFGTFYEDLFHSNGQLEELLQDGYDGRRLTINTDDGVQLDCMLFPFNKDKVTTKKEMEEEKQRAGPQQYTSPKYLKYPTIIFFNPNAQIYQSHVQHSNSFWLRYFLSKNINVFSWNYRAYGRSTGNPNPYNTYHDAERVLKFLIEDLAIQGKIGCFGRSIGGTIATHLANSYPEHIEFLFIDRSLGSLDVMSESNFLGSFSRNILSHFS